MFPRSSSTRTATILAASADVDLRTARKALRKGAESVRGRAGERILEAAKALGIALPDAPQVAAA